MKNETNNTARMGMLLALTAIAALCLPPQVRAGGGTFYPTVTNVTQLIADINYANTAGGTFTINLLPNTNFDLITGNGSDAFGADLLPVIGCNLTILGNGDTIQRDATTYEIRLFEVAKGSSLTLDQMTLQNGYSFEFGGGAIHNLGTLTISNCILSGNTSELSGYSTSSLDGKGGAIYNDSGTVTISDSSLTRNQAYGNANPIGYGAAIYNDSGTVTISNSPISGNGADDGGGIYNAAGTMTIFNSPISGNGAEDGGGIYNAAGTMTIFNSPISGNGAFGDGGGIFNSGTVTISQSTIFSNSANYYYDDDGDVYGGDGGGIYNIGTVTVENSSGITGNSAADSGPDVYNLGTLYLDGTSTTGVLVGNSAMGLSPMLSIASWSSTAHQLVLSWSTNYTGCTLQSSTDPGSANWTDCASPTVSGASFVVTNSMSAGAQFFRLKR